MENKHHSLSKEEITKQFMLPERKDKIAALLKQYGQAYCICRSFDCSRFMIGCDACDEWYHGDCIKITEKEAKHIKEFFCTRCTEKNSSLVTKYKTKKVKKAKTFDENEHDQEQDKETEKYIHEAVQDSTQIKKSSIRCGECSGCLRTNNCGKCNACRHLKKGLSIKLKPFCDQRICRVLDDNQLQLFKSNSKLNGKLRRRSTKKKMDYLEPPRHCYGPSCAKQSRPGSKYCSEDCGMKLATSRIFQVLPQRLQEWFLTPSVAEHNNRIALDTIQTQIRETQSILDELNQRHAELDKIIEYSKNITIETLKPETDDIDNEMTMYCVTCGHEITLKSAIKHMEKCFNKYESQASFESFFKTNFKGKPMFCDFYNPVSEAYCKKLKVLCPEHCKDPKIIDTEVCGCPLVTNVFDITGELCRISKKHCVKHYMWEKLRRAEIDNERINQCLKLDDLVEQKKQILLKQASRGGLLALLLHSTYNHELMETILLQQQKREKIMEVEQCMNRGSNNLNRII